MVSITDVNSTAVFAKERTEAHNRALEAIAELKDIYAELSHSHRQFLKLSRGMVGECPAANARLLVVRVKRMPMLRDDCSPFILHRWMYEEIRG